MLAAVGSVNKVAALGWSCLGVGILAFGVLGSLLLFQWGEKQRFKRYKKYVNNEIIIDVKSETIEE
jgi:hypothetical protein